MRSQPLQLIPGFRFNLSATRVAADALAIALLSVALAHGTMVVSPTFEEMVDRADSVFVGKVVGSRADWRTVGTDRLIFTRAEFETREVLKGRAGASVTLEFLGGAIGDVKLEVADVPRFSAGDRVLLFVEGNGIQFCPLVVALLSRGHTVTSRLGAADPPRSVLTI